MGNTMEKFPSPVCVTETIDKLHNGTSRHRSFVLPPSHMVRWNYHMWYHEIARGDYVDTPAWTLGGEGGGHTPYTVIDVCDHCLIIMHLAYFCLKGACPDFCVCKEPWFIPCIWVFIKFAAESQSLQASFLLCCPNSDEHTGNRQYMHIPCHKHVPWRCNKVQCPWMSMKLKPENTLLSKLITINWRWHTSQVMMKVSFCA